MRLSPDLKLSRTNSMSLSRAAGPDPTQAFEKTLNTALSDGVVYFVSKLATKY